MHRDGEEGSPVGLKGMAQTVPSPLAAQCDEICDAVEAVSAQMTPSFQMKDPEERPGTIRSVSPVNIPAREFIVA
jgi:hypothetical protein